MRPIALGIGTELNIDASKVATTWLNIYFRNGQLFQWIQQPATDIRFHPNAVYYNWSLYAHLTQYIFCFMNHPMQNVLQ